MSNETALDLQVNFLIGMVAERGHAWHRRTDLLKGREDNAYQGMIPVGDVLRRILHWQPNTVEVGYLVPCDVDKADFIRADGQAVRIVETKSGRVGVLRSDNDYDLGIFKQGVVHPPYAETLIRDVEKLTGTTLGISGAGVMAKGARAYVEMSLPATCHDDKSGFSYRPNLVKATSMDGSLAHITARTIGATVCDNTFRANLLEADRAGTLFRRKHTSLSLGSLQEERDALGILEQTNEEFLADLHTLIDMGVSKEQRIEVMDILVPLPDEEGRALTMAENKRDALFALDTDPMVAPWMGTAFGEVQRFSTYEHWFSSVKTDDRGERNAWRGINGKAAELDRSVVKALELVLA